MAVYIIQGKLGAGKGLCSVGRCQEYLLRGRPVATNLDLNLHNLLPKTNKTAVVYRLPDHPKIEDLEMIGHGKDISDYDESNNGLLCLDEIGTWFNARNFKDKTRQPVIDWLLHARKYGWDVLLQVQDFSLLDSQARNAIAEHIVNCKRMDRIPIPIFSGILRFIGFSALLPKVFVATVRIGQEKDSPVVDRWTYYGTKLFNCYDTKQIFSPFYKHGTFQYLPPYYTHLKTLSIKNLGFYMRMTKIYLKRFTVPMAFCSGILLCLFFVSITHTDNGNASVEPSAIADSTLDPKKEKIEEISEIQSIDNEFFEWQYISSVRISKHGRTVVKVLYNGRWHNHYDFKYDLKYDGSDTFAYLPVLDTSTELM